jgi:hypothetical protein
MGLHPCSLIRIHAVRYHSFSTCYRVCKRTAWILIRLRGCAGCGLDPCWSQTHYVGFVVTRLNYYFSEARYYLLKFYNMLVQYGVTNQFCKNFHHVTCILILKESQYLLPFLDCWYHNIVYLSFIKVQVMMICLILINVFQREKSVNDQCLYSL